MTIIHGRTDTPAYIFNLGGEWSNLTPSETLTGSVELIGFASLPADTFAPGPSSGNFIDTENRETPFTSQPVQGFSGVQFTNDGNYWFLSDNGFGAKSNSADFLLRIYKVEPDFKTETNGTGEVEWTDFIQLGDPNNLIPFDIVNENTDDRLLTGTDFDVESLVIADDGTIWIGDEFGPYLLHFDSNGVLLDAPIATPNITNLNTLEGQEPLVIGHRGASGELPEHTLEAYKRAIEQGADFIEPDLVSTSDGVLIARHEPILAQVELDENGAIKLDAQGSPIVLSATTNIATLAEFADRVTIKMLDGTLIGGWFADDFTLEEIKTLRARQPRSYRPQEFNDLYEIPTLDEIIDLVQQVEAETGQTIGIYPETKHPTYFDDLDLSLEENLVETLLDQGFTDPDRIFIQSFEVANLLDLQNNLLAGTELEKTPLVQLYDEFHVQPYDIVANFSDPNFDPIAVYGSNVITAETNYGDLINQEGDDSQNLLSDFVANYASGIGPWKRTFVLTEPLATPVDGNRDGVAEISEQLTGEILPVIEDAHAAGLQVHPYTFRDEERFLVLNPDGTPQTAEQEYQQFIQLGVDGFFTDFPATGDQVRDQIVADQVRSLSNPDVLAGTAVANLANSKGFEGMAYSPDRQTLYPILEGVVTGDRANALRIYEFDVATQTFADQLVGYYGLENASHAIGDFTPINETEFLIIERDNGQSTAAQFKKIYKIDISQTDQNGYVQKEELVNLLNIADPNDLNGDGSQLFTFPFVTIENLIILDETTLLVANDNNYPFSIGRGSDIDNNEIITLKLSEPLNLDPRLGTPETPLPSTAYGTPGNDTFDSVRPDAKRFVGEGQILFTGSGDDTVDVTFAIGGNRIDLGSGDDILFAGANNRILAGSGNDTLFVGSGGGNNLITGGLGVDQFWIVTDEEDLSDQENIITDFTAGTDVIGFANTNLTFNSLTITQNGANTILNALGQNLAILQNIQAANLSVNDFAFA
ncbi:esterase-like activity of phytase family protein [Chroococcus sp. FPU101]|uniref:esterase-like activity of phytase family protein n=1 Tax=Chroococcus sp. FPU101 TaxID=1974212 RepID=UPI001A8E54BB|nr:esterase-like activity of phytase family protein [Chroococcus sp. FPU101]GFE69197.1 glycerophosphoryl diester phosphodiesterase [Chroococcus sp. FPU101]